MSSDLMRRYIDILNENAQPRQLDEGIVDSVKSFISSMSAKVKSLPGFAQAYEKAKQFAPQYKQIFMTSKSGEEVVQKIKELVASGSQQTEPQGVGENIIPRLAGAGLAAGGAAGLLNTIINKSAIEIGTLINQIQTQNASPAAFDSVVLPLMAFVGGVLILMMAASQKSK